MNKPKIGGLTALEWVERAKDTLDQRTRNTDDVELIDAYDDLCNALEILEHEAKS